MFSQA
jgi:hypothetical protein